MPFFVPLLAGAIALSVKTTIFFLALGTVFATLDLLSLYVYAGFATLVYQPLDRFMMATPFYLSNRWYCSWHTAPTFIGKTRQYLYCSGAELASSVFWFLVCLSAVLATGYVIVRVCIAISNAAAGMTYMHRFQANTLALLPAWRSIPVTLGAAVTNALHGEGAAQAVFERAEHAQRNRMAMPINLVVEGVQNELELLVSFGAGREEMKAAFINHVCAYIETTFVNSPDFSTEKNNHAKVCVASFGDQLPKKNAGHMCSLLSGVFGRAAVASRVV